MTVKEVSCAALAAFCLAGATSCGRDRAAAGGQPADSAARAATADVTLAEVTVAAPAAASLQGTVDAPGTLIPSEEATIAAEGAGPVLAVQFDEGTRAAQGDVLVRLDSAKAELAVKQAEAMLVQARANLEKAKSDLTRKQVLLADRTIAPSTFDAFKAQHDGAAAGVEAADVALRLARRRLEDMTVKAPFAGVVKDKRVSAGQYVREGETLLTLMRVDPLKLQFEVPEKYADRVAVGQQVRAMVVAIPGEEFTGTIQTLFPAVSVQSRTLRVDARLPNPSYRLKPGFYASVRVPIAGLRGSLVVPRSALVKREGLDNVFVLKGDRAELVRVQTGAESADRVEIISGVTERDRVVVSGADTLRPGDRVKVRG